MSTEQQENLEAALRRSPIPVGSSVIEQRRLLRERASARPAPADVTVTPAELGGVPAAEITVDRIEPRHVVLYFHGGVYVLGDAFQSADLASQIVRRAQARVISLDYRLAPEHPYPAAVDDALAAYDALLREGTAPSEIAFAGDSAGGGLAVATLVNARDHGLPLFTGPQPVPGVSVGVLVAAALNPLDIAFVNDQFPLRRLQPPCVAGYEAVVQLADGTRWYVTAPPAPYGTLAELVPVSDSDGFPVPAGLDPALAAALGVAGLAGWLALDYRAHLQPGETVLVLGAGGSAGRLAVQSARVLGAGLVVGAARGKDPAQAADLGADAVVDLADEQAIDAGLAAAAPGGYDVIVDFLWGGVAPHAMNHAKPGARYIQVGNSAGAASTITGLVLRNKLLTLVGHSLFATPAEVRRSAYARLAGHAVDGKLIVDLEQTRLEDISGTWEHLKTGSSRKLVVTP